MSSRSERRRKGKPQPPRRELPLGRTERIAVAFLGAGLIAILGAFLISRALSGGGDDDGAARTDATSTTTATSGGSVSDENDIRALARRSIEVLPQGQWPSLYNDFTTDFQARCTLAAFTQAGVDSATNLGASLQKLEFHDMKELSITGDTATATIVGDIKDQADSQYDVEAAFAREGGRWKLAAATDTTGCQAFNVLS